ncbi:MAG: hypothetical protein HYU66_19420 [Armatimonadetes bacterium]|nr:hypothetical protein [Armatimonadota bacterium]
MAPDLHPTWSVLTHYDQSHLTRIALPLGGIGTGTVALGGRGDLRDWEVVNRPAKGFRPRDAFFALYAKPAGGEAVCRALEGALEPPFEGAFGSPEANHGLPRFRHCAFHAAYPLAQVLLDDPDVPLWVRLEAFNPLVPADAETSGIPVAVLRFQLINSTDRAVSAAVCGNLANFIGTDGSGGACSRNVNERRDGDRVRGVLLRSDGVDPAAEQWGTLALTTTARTGLSHRLAWAQLSWGDTLLDYWDDFSSDGALDDRVPGGRDDPTASLAVRLRVPEQSARTVTFLLTWHFPNRQTWTPEGNAADTIGNHYTTRYADAWDVAERVASELPRLEEETAGFVRAVCEADLPPVVKEAALDNLSTLRSQTCFRTPDGRFYGWEGCGDRQGCCPGSCTHVWNYEQAAAFLFGELACAMREVEFGHSLDDRGMMSFRVGLPLERARKNVVAAADGQMGCLIKLYRDWQLSGDEAMLRALWPGARKALEFCWIEGGWDADQDGVMEGCQHNTMDVEYYGPNPQMAAWYLGALRAGEEMARHLGDDGFAARCRELFERGRAWVDQHLFNGEYYEHEIRPPGEGAAIAAGLKLGMGAGTLTEPDLQLGAGCLVDQLVGQFLAEVAGLGYLLDPDHVRTTLRSIVKYNRREGFFGHFNHMRSFVLSDEAGLLMASYPRGRRPTRPFPYYTEVMTGFEYAAAVHLLYEGEVGAGLRSIADIRARYDGRRRNPFDEAECGHHYARAMASWAALLALTGFRYSGVEQRLELAAVKASTRIFWSNGWAWGTGRLKPTRQGMKVELLVLGGVLKLRTVVVTGLGEARLDRPRRVGKGKLVTVEVRRG